MAIGEGEGSNHFAEGDVMVYAGVQAPPWAPNALLGPVVVAKVAWRNTHTTHPHFHNPAGTYQVTHQLNWRTQQRVVD